MKDSVDGQTASVPDGPASREEILMPFIQISDHTCWKYTVALEQMRCNRSGGPHLNGYLHVSTKPMKVRHAETHSLGQMEASLRKSRQP